MEKDSPSEDEKFTSAVNPEDLLPGNKLSPEERQILDDKAPDLHLRDGEIVSDIEDFSKIAVSHHTELTVTEAIDALSGHGKHIFSAALTDLDDPNSAELNKFKDIPFARDGLVQAHLYGGAEQMKVTLLGLAESQGTSTNIMSEEEPGKTVHEDRPPNDRWAVEITKRLGWEWPYYGAMDATMKNVSELSSYAKDHPGFLDTPYLDKAMNRQTMRHSLELALEFIDKKQSENELGLIEYKRLNPQGIENQAWRDSKKSMSHHDGTLANYEQPIANFQVQTDAYDALLNTAELFEQLAAQNHDDALAERAKDLHERANHLQSVILDKFWEVDEQGGYFVVGRDRDAEGTPRQLDTRTCDMVFAMSSRLLDNHIDDQKVEALVRTIFSEEMLNASGIRTLSDKEEQFTPGGYHMGSVWAWITAYAVEAMDKHGLPQLAELLRERIRAVVDTFGYVEHSRGGTGDTPEITTINVNVESKNSDGVVERTAKEAVAQKRQGWTVLAAYIAQKQLDPNAVSANPELEAEIIASLEPEKAPVL